MYLPVGSGHSTLIKVSSMRSPGRGNRSITRTSALSTLSWALVALPPSPKNPLPGRTSVYQTSWPLWPRPFSRSTARNILGGRRNRPCLAAPSRTAPPPTAPTLSAGRQEYRGGWHAYKSLSIGLWNDLSFLFPSFLPVRSVGTAVDEESRRADDGGLQGDQSERPARARALLSSSV